MGDNYDGDIHIVQWPSVEAEATGIAEFIHRKIQAHEFDPGRILVLSPRRQFGYLVRDALTDRGHQAHSFFHEEALDGNPKIEHDCQAQEAFTILTLLVNPNDRVALRCWLGFGSNSLRAREYHRLREYCAGSGLSPREGLDALCNRSLTIPHTTGIADRYRQLVQRLEALGVSTGQEVLDALFPTGQEWAEPLRTILEDSANEHTVESMLNALRSTVTQPELPSDVGYIRIMSLHKSKGLNADHVVVIGCVEGLIPMRKMDGPFEEQMRNIEEQRRLFYVAITRPKRTLVLSSVLSLPRDLAHKIGAMVLQGGNQHVAETITSTFIAELGPRCPQPVSGGSWDY